MFAGAAALLVGCSSGDPDPAAAEQTTTPAAQTMTPAEQPTTSAARSTTEAEENAVPAEIIVCQPGAVDTTATVDDVPQWPGPDPVDFMTMTPDTGACGTLTGEDAKVVYEAALASPGSIREEGESSGEPGGALWALGTVVVWLTVQPVG